MRSVLVVADLEGVAGVDDAAALSAASADFAPARRLLTAEVAAVVRGLRARGVERIRVSDSHRPGVAAPTVVPEALPDGVELSFEGDAYDARLLESMDAVACVGMHAAAGEPGFAAHTVSVHCRWRQAGRELSETDLLLALAAEAGVPALLVSGDDVLERSVRGPQFLRAKQAVSPLRAASRPPAEVCAELARLAERAQPVRLAPLAAELEIGFKSRWMADAAAAHGLRRGAHAVRVNGRSFREAYRRGVEAVESAAPILARALRTHQASLFVTDVTRMLARRFPAGEPPPCAAEARRALAWFLDATAPGTSRPSPAIADRALVLWMLAGHAPGFFAAEGLAPALDAALDALAALPASFPPGLEPAEAMARLDGLYLLAERATPRAFDAAELAAYLRWLAGAEPPIWAWLCVELAARMGLGRAVSVPPRAMREASRVADLYWLTHLPLLATGYLRRPLALRLDAEIEELTLAAPEAMDERRADLAAEIAICLQAAGERETAEHHDLLAFLRAHQRPDGRVDDPSVATLDGAEAERLRAHVTGAALLAFAGARP